MKQGWENKTLGDVLDVLRNGVNCKQDKKGVGDKISRIESISNADFDIDKVGFALLSQSDKEKYRLVKGDILFSHINSPIHVGKTALFNSDEEVYHGVNLLLMRPKPFLDGNYFEHFLKFLFQNGYWKGLCKQSVNQASVNQQDINKVEINYPKSLAEQQLIVAILDEAFTAIAKAKANAEQNLKNAKELFESYLQGVFDPSTRSGQGNKGEDWEEKTLGDIGKPSMCKRILKNQTSSTGDVPFYKIGTFGKTPNAYISQEIYDEFRAKYSFPKKGDVLISASGTIGRRVRYDGEPAFFQDSNIVWIDNDESQVLNDYLYVFYEFCDWQPSKGATIARLYNSNLTSIKIVFPKSLEEQKNILKKINLLSLETKKLEAIYQQKIKDLEELKKSVLQKAFSGELKTNAVLI
jgi:type I restriction enzyme S subunit